MQHLHLYIQNHCNTHLHILITAFTMQHRLTLQTLITAFHQTQFTHTHKDDAHTRPINDPGNQCSSWGQSPLLYTLQPLPPPSVDFLPSWPPHAPFSLLQPCESLRVCSLSSLHTQPSSFQAIPAHKSVNKRSHILMRWNKERNMCLCRC